jgi:hypothetical protein
MGNLSKPSGHPASGAHSRLRAQLAQSDEQGAVLVEFALVITLFLFLVFGLVDFGLAINTKTQIAVGGREGARLGTVNLDAGAVETRVRDVTGDLNQTDLTVTIECRQPDGSLCNGGGTPPGSLSLGQSGDSVVVTVDYLYQMFTPLPNFLGGGSQIPLKSMTEMRIE